MKRYLELVWPAIGLATVLFSGWALYGELKDMPMSEVADQLRSISLLHWALAIAATAMAYVALTWYDQIALAHLGRKLSWRFVAVVAFTTYALAHNVGASVFSGAVIRYRAYSTKGLGAAEIGVLVAFCSFTFTLGNLMLGGLVLAAMPEMAHRFGDMPTWAGRLISMGLLGFAALYVVGSLLHFRPLTIGGFNLVYPRPPIAFQQLFAGPVELIGAAGIIYFALPEAHNPGFIVVLGVFLASFTAALISHAPGGLGVLEFAFLKAMPDAPRSGVLAALIVFRLLYLLIPLAFSLVAVVLFERGRVARLMRAQAGDPSG